MYSNEENALIAQITSIEIRIKGLEQGRSLLLERLHLIRQAREEKARKSVQEVQTSCGEAAAEPAILKSVALIRRLFRGREDVYAFRWESIKTGRSGYQPACRNEWEPDLCDKKKVKCSECSHRNLLPLTDEAIMRHLTGRGREGSSKRSYNPYFFIGIYPLLSDETCWFLAVDFDKDSWQEDLGAFRETCRSIGIPAHGERSRSGRGGHVWIFFEEALPASMARDLGSFLLSGTMERRPDIGFESYDRLFPSQDTLPLGGFGNLIALPLNHHAAKKGNSLFVDEDFRAYDDQFAYLSSIVRLGRKEVEDMVRDAGGAGKIAGVRVVLTDRDDDEPWTMPPSRRPREHPLQGPFPETLSVVKGSQLFIEREPLTPSLVNRIIRLAAFQNPEFYKAQAMRYSTFGKPRIISCAEIFPHHIGLPRGCEDEFTHLLETLKVKILFKDERNAGKPVSVHFQEFLRPEQRDAAQALRSHDAGVLSAPTAFGKTIVAAYMIAVRRVNTLVLVHRIQLLEQWMERLSSYFGIDKKMIGQIGGGKRKPSDFIDIALLQSLRHKNEVDDIVASYGHIIIDECHHIPAESFEDILQACKARYVLGLSATVVRKDGHHPIVFMQCGPLRFRADSGKSTAGRPFNRVVIVKETPFRFDVTITSETRIPIQDIYRLMLQDDTRNLLIVRDVIEALNADRFPLVLTERKEHVDIVTNQLRAEGVEVIVLKGGMGIKERRKALERLSEREEGCSRMVIVATGRYIGEGFDFAPLDTMFLAMPVSWRGTLAQYAGRLHRLHEGKREVRIYDYVDCQVPFLARMHQKRLKGYKAMGYEVT